MQDTAGEAWTSSEVMNSYGLPRMAGQKQDDQLEHTFSSYVRIWDVALKTYQRRWTIGRSGERGSGISVLAARHDDDDDSYSIQIIPKHIYFSPVGWGCRVRRLYLWRRIRLHPQTSALDSTLNCIWWGSSLGALGVVNHCHCSRVYSEW